MDYFFQKDVSYATVIAIALAGLRIEIESRLRKIAEEQIAVIRDLLGLLNRAIHADDIDLTSAQWTANEGTALLNGLDRLAASRADRRVETKKTVRRPARPG